MDTNLAYNDDKREYEFFDGKVVMLASPSMNHLFVAENIYEIFKHFLRGKSCTPIPDGATLYLKDEKNEEVRLKPDMMLVCDKSKLRRQSGSANIYGAPDLVVEVLSPSTTHFDKGRKMQLYELNGVREYWLVSPTDMSVEQYVLENGRLVFRYAYVYFTPERIEDLEEDEMNIIMESFKCTLFEDLDIRLDEIFYGVEP